jgi:hypothetical protein
MNVTDTDREILADIRDIHARSAQDDGFVDTGYWAPRRIRRLISLGLIESKPGNGMRIRPLPPVMLHATYGRGGASASPAGSHWTLVVPSVPNVDIIADNLDDAEALVRELLRREQGWTADCYVLDIAIANPVETVAEDVVLYCDEHGNQDPCRWCSHA